MDQNVHCCLRNQKYPVKTILGTILKFIANLRVWGSFLYPKQAYFWVILPSAFNILQSSHSVKKKGGTWNNKQKFWHCNFLTLWTSLYYQKKVPEKKFSGRGSNRPSNVVKPDFLKILKNFEKLRYMSSIHLESFWKYNFMINKVNLDIRSQI